MSPFKLLIAAALVLFVFFAPDSSFGQGQVFTKTTDVPRPSKTPKPITLKSLSGNARLINVRAFLTEDRKDQKASKGGAGGTARLTTMQKYSRIEIRGANELTKPSQVEVGLTIEQGDETGSLVQKVGITEFATNYVIDTEGFTDQFGSEIKTKTTSTRITSTKYIYPEAEVIGLYVIVTDEQGNALFSGGWPNEPNIPVKVPDYMKTREFTSVDGRKLQAAVASVENNVATLVVNGVTYQVPFDKLSPPDQEFLKSWKK